MCDIWKANAAKKELTAALLEKHAPRSALNFESLFASNVIIDVFADRAPFAA